MYKSHSPIQAQLCHKSQSGVVLPFALIVFIVMSVIGLSIASLSFNRLSLTTRNVHVTNSLLAAESGVDLTLRELNLSDAFPGYTTQQELFNNQQQGRGTYETTITPGSTPDEKIITAVGRVYFPSTATGSPRVTRTIRLVAGRNPTGSYPLYAVHAGPDGVVFNDSSSATGSVYVNGKITLNDNSQIGTAADPQDVWAVNEPCTVPFWNNFVCSRAEPIWISTPSSHIYGDVRANGQVSTSYMTDNGLIASSGVSNQPIPSIPHDRAAQKAAATTTMTSSVASCNGNEVRTWPANLHITGASRVHLRNSCTILVEGDIWIDSSMLIENSASIQPAPSVVATPTIMIDGNPIDPYGSVPFTSLIFNNNTAAGTGSNPAGVGMRFIVYFSRAACSPDCTSLTPAEAALSRVHSIILNNNVDAGDAILVSRWGLTTLNNSAQAGSLSGQFVILNNTSRATGDAVFINSAGGAVGTPSPWTVKLYQGIQ